MNTTTSATTPSTPTLMQAVNRKDFGIVVLD
jgi:hypothetical protein